MNKIVAHLFNWNYYIEVIRTIKCNKGQDSKMLTTWEEEENNNDAVFETDYVHQ